MPRRMIVEPLPERQGLINCYWQGGGVYLVRAEGSERRVQREPAEFSCVVRTADLSRETSRQLRTSNAVVALKREADDAWTRVCWRDFDVRNRGCEWLELERQLATYEGNLSPVRRRLLDRPEHRAEPLLSYLDIETDSRLSFREKLEMRVLCWSVIDGQTGEAHRGMLNEETDQDERRLLVEMCRVLDRYDQIAAWNGQRFDFPIVIERTLARYRLEMQWRRLLLLDHMVLFKRMNTAAAESGEEKQSMKLDDVAQEVTGVGKMPFDSRKSWEAWAAGGARRQELGDYNEHDGRLMRDVERETGYIALLGSISEICGSFPDTRGADPTNQVESLLFWLARENGERVRTRLVSKKEDDLKNATKYKGAFVLKPRESGIIKDVHVADFKSLYPSVIQTFNMSTDTKLGGWGDWSKPDPEGAAVAPLTGVRFSQGKEGLLPMTIAKLVELRDKWTAVMAGLPPKSPAWRDAERKAKAGKTTYNSVYGVGGSPFSVIFDREVAESVTQGGRWLIEQTIAEAERQGMRVIYSDTDSLLVRGVTAGRFREFVDWCNAELYPRLLTERGVVRNHIKLAYEAEFERLVLVKAKKYCAIYKTYKGQAADANAKPEVKGLEYKRGDSLKLARSFQREVIEMLMIGKVEDPSKFDEVIERYKRQVLEQELTVADVTLSKGLGKPLAGYKMKTKKDGTPASPPPHVVVAHVLSKRGHDVGEGSRIDYVCVDGSTSPKRYVPAEDCVSGDQADRYELWECHVYAPTQRLLEAAFPGGGWRGHGKVRPKKPRRGSKVALLRRGETQEKAGVSRETQGRTRRRAL